MTYDEAVAFIEQFGDAPGIQPALRTITAEVERARGERDKYHKYHLADIGRAERAEATLGRYEGGWCTRCGQTFEQSCQEASTEGGRAALAPDPTEERLRRFARESEGPENPAGGYIQ